MLTSSAILLGQPVNRSHPLNEALQAWWLGLPGMLGSRWFDLSGRQRHGTVINGVTWAGGQVGYAGKFDGVDDYVNVGNVLNAEANWSVAAWVKRTATGVRHDIVSKEDGPTGWYLAIPTSNKVEFSVTNGTSWPAVESVTLITNTTKWYHICGVRDSVTASFYMYIDGVRDNTAAVTTGPAASTTSLYIGNRTGTPQYFSGFINDLRISNQALSRTQVRQLYELSLRGYPGVLNRASRVWLQAAAAAPSIMAQERSKFRRINGRMFSRVN